MSEANGFDVDELKVLPLTVAALDLYVADLCKAFELPNNDDTYESVATMIMHVPPSACRVPMRFFGESVLKSIANKAAHEKLQEFRDKRTQARVAAQIAENAKLEDTVPGVSPEQPIT